MEAAQRFDELNHGVLLGGGESTVPTTSRRVPFAAVASSPADLHIYVTLVERPYGRVSESLPKSMR